MISLGIIAAVFIAANIYFIAADPALWLDSVASPVIDSMFPLGVGIIALVMSGVVDIRNPLIFTVLESIILICAVIWYWRYVRKYPEAGPVLAVLPVFFAWRGLWCYFFYVTIIIFAGMLVKNVENYFVIPNSIGNPASP